MTYELIWSLKNGDLEQVKEHFDANDVDVNSPIEGRPPIHYASDYGQKEIVEYLISRGANVNATDKFGITALLAAIWEGHTECVRLMIQNGADKNGKTPDGKPYLDVADKPEIAQLLL